MAIDFGLSWYFFNEKKPQHLDKRLAAALGKIVAYEHHTVTTSGLYRKEEDQMREVIDTLYKEQRAVAYPKYLSLLKENEGNDYAESFASHDSGMDALEYFHQEEDEALHHRFKEILDYFYKSSLAQAYALLESELRMVCTLLQEKLGLAISLEHLKGGYLEAIWNYLELVCSITKEGFESYKTKFAEVGALRNKIMHNGGMFPTNNLPKEIQQTISANKGTLRLKEVDNFSILEVQETYLLQLYSEMKFFFSDLLWSIDATLHHELLKERMRYMLGFLASDIAIQITAIKKAPKSVLNIYADAHSKKAGFTINFILSIMPAATNSIEIVDQDTMIEEVQRLKVYLEDNPSVLPKKILGPFSPVGAEGVKAKLLLFPIQSLSSKSSSSS